MPLRVTELVQSGPGVSADQPGRPAFVRSHVYEVLVRELNRFLTGEVRGRSFLISGHRGSGKTSLVLRAVDDLSAVVSLENRPQRPLLVKLHGPSLISMRRAEDTSREATEKSSSNESVETLSDKSQPSAVPIREASDASAAQQVLIQITIALYRALSAEIARCYRRRAATLSEKQKRADLFEQAAQLQLELDKVASPAVLRGFWNRLSALAQGVLWSGTLLESRMPLDQGMRELVALVTAGQAYQVVSGAITYQTVQKASAENEASITRETRVDIKDAANALFGVIAGTLVGAALLQQGTGVAASATAGVFTALFTQWSFGIVTSRSRRQSSSTEYTFLRDHSVQTLDRELPLVIERIREAGLAPVFLVDELDKIDGLEYSMAQLVQRLKHLVADYSFFCFLTDRNYYEYLLSQPTSQAYPPEHTYFSHRLFVLYQPRQLHIYLAQLIQITFDPERAVRSPTSDALGKEALSLLLLHRAMMHTFDLQRELARLCDDTGYVTLSADRLVSHLGYRFNIMVQLAIEHLLDEEEVRDRFDQDPLFGQLAYDSLYYVSRNWLGGGGRLDLDESEIDAYLAGRVHEHRERVGEAGNQPRVLGPLDRRFLMEKIRRLAHLLANPDLLVTDLRQRTPLDAVVLQLIETIPLNKEAQLLSKAEDRNVYRWHRDVFGRLLTGVEAPAPSEERQRSEVSFIEAVAGFLREIRILPSSLAEGGILRTSPAWTQVQEALTRQKSFFETGETYEEIEHDQVIIREYAGMLSSRGELLATSLICAAVISRDAGMDVQIGARLATTVICRAIAFRAVVEQHAMNVLSMLVPLPGSLITLVPILEPSSFDAWRTSVAAAWHRISDEPRFVPVPPAWFDWESWRMRMQNARLAKTVPQVTGYFCDPPPSYPELLDNVTREALSVASTTDSAVKLRWDLTTMTIRDWSRLVWAGLADDSGHPNDSTPFWATFAALAYLGWGGNLWRIRDSLTRPTGIAKWGTQVFIEDWQASPGTLLQASPGILLVEAGQGSLADEIPTEGIPVLSLRSSELRSAVWSNPEFLAEFYAVAVEWTGVIDSKKNVLEFPSPLRRLRRIDFSRQPIPADSTANPDHFYGIASLHQLIDQVNRLDLTAKPGAPGETRALE
jgi:hypothetical protein